MPRVDERRRDPEVKALTAQTLRLVGQAESVLSQVVEHQDELAELLDHLDDFTEQLSTDEGGSDA